MSGGSRELPDADMLRVAGHWNENGNHVRAMVHDRPAEAVGQRLYAVWHRLADRTGRVPILEGLEALGVPEAIPGMILAVPERDCPEQRPERFVAAFVGEEVQRVWGEDFTGQVMYSDMFPEIYAAMADGIRATLERKSAIAIEYRVQIAFRVNYLHSLFMPFKLIEEDRLQVLIYVNFSNITIGGSQDWRTTLETQERIQRLLEERPSQDPVPPK